MAWIVKFGLAIALCVLQTSY